MTNHTDGSAEFSAEYEAVNHATCINCGCGYTQKIALMHNQPWSHGTSTQCISELKYRVAVLEARLVVLNFCGR